MPAAAIPIATSAIGGIFSGIGAGKPKTSTSSYDNKSTQEGVLTGKQQKINKQLFEQILAALKLGPTVSQGDRNTARSQINQNYDTGIANVDANLAARGMSGGGTTGKEYNKLAISRATNQQSAEATLRDQATQKFMQMLGIAQNFIVPKTFTTTSSGTQTGQQSGTPWQSTAGSGISDLGQYLYLSKMMRANGGGGSGSYGTAPGYDDLGNYNRGCAIARELWGARSWKVTILRAWLVKQAEKSWRWNLGFGIYKRTGRVIARLIRAGVFRPQFERLFDGMLVRAINA